MVGGGGAFVEKLEKGVAGYKTSMVNLSVRSRIEEMWKRVVKAYPIECATSMTPTCLSVGGHGFSRSAFLISITRSRSLKRDGTRHVSTIQDANV